MPNRIVREGILTSERVNSLSPNAELFYRRLISVVDDFGRYTANPTLLRAACYPLKLDSVKEDSISKHLAECVGARLIVLYTVADKAYLELQDFRQQLRAKDSKYPAPVGSLGIEEDASHVHSTCIADATHMRSTCVAHAHLDGDGDGDDKRNSAPPDGGSPERIPYAQILEAFNRIMKGLSKARELTPKRKTLIRSAWNASKDRQSLEFFEAYFEECQDDPFNNGTGPYSPPHENWRPTFDYLMRADVITKIYEKAMDRLERGQ